MRILIAGGLLWAAFAVACLWIASSQPWLGLEFKKTTSLTEGIQVAQVIPGGPADGRLQVGDVITRIQAANGAAAVLGSQDIIGSPTYLSRYTEQDEFFARQQIIAYMLDQGSILASLADGRQVQIDLAPRRPLHAVPLSALLQFTLLPGVAMLIALTVWHQRPRDTAARYVIGCAMGYALLVTDALYAKRELALPETLFRTLVSIENIGGLILLGGSAVAMLWNHPAPLTRRPAAPWIYAIALAAGAIHYFQFFASLFLGFWLWCLLSFAAQAVVAGLQWRRARGRPAHRAMLKWLLVPWFSLAGMYTALFYIPASAGLGPQAPSLLGWTLFLLIFMGVAFGLTRFRLYYLNPANLLVWFLDGALILGLLGLGLYGFDLPYFFAACFALAVTGVLHIGVRDAVWSAQALRFADFARVLKMVLETLSQCRTAAEVRMAWWRTLDHLFQPRAMSAAQNPVEQVEILVDGERMHVPQLTAGSGVVLELPFRGRGLFTPRDVRAVKDLHRIFKAVQRHLESYREGEAMERLRLCHALDAGLDHSLERLARMAPTGEARGFAEQARLELQRISRALAEPPRPLLPVLAELRDETQTRCTAAGIHLRWQQSSLPDTSEFSGQAIFDLQSIFREAVTNAIRHSAGTTLRIQLDWQHPDSLQLVIEDNGLGSPDTVVSGRGIGNMRRRAQNRGGDLDLRAGASGGLCIRALLPMS